MKRWIVATALLGSLLGQAGAVAADPNPVATQDSDGNWSVDVPVKTSEQRMGCAAGVEVRNNSTAVSVTLGPSIQMVWKSDPQLGQWLPVRPLARSEARSLNCGLPAKLAHAQREIRRLRAALAAG